ncbi:MAG TPA: response regulator transcription factor [Candidatus Saccharimonadales bacterium]|nr:response regulator transcription factor [Candidatus Saccharimonadales bacterium]
MRLLIIEDEQKIARALKKGLRQEGFAVDVCFNGDEGLRFALDEPYDVMVLDRMLPGLDGIAICKALRAANVQTPIIMLTAKDKVSDRVQGLNAGADDYLVKPFAFEELLARLRSLLRRPHELSPDVLTCHDLTLNVQTHEVYRNQTAVELTQKEFALLEFLLRRNGMLATKDIIIAHVWDYDADVLPNTVEVYIGYLRQKIDKAFPGKPPLIHTRRGFGYKIGAET